MRSFFGGSFPCSWLLLLLVVEQTHAQSELDRPTNYTYDDPVVFNEWCQQMKDMFGPSCVCTTTYGASNNIDALDLNHEIICDPLQGNSTCIDTVTIETARVWLKANSIGEVGNYQNIQQTVINDLHVLLDETSIGTISFRYNNLNFDQRRSGCEAVFGGINCARCGLCNLPAENRTDGIRDHISPNDVFAGISGQCRYFEGALEINNFDTCSDGDNVLTRIVFKDLEITSPEEGGPCPADTSSESPEAGDVSGATAAIKLATMTVASMVSLATWLLVQ